MTVDEYSHGQKIVPALQQRLVLRGIYGTLLSYIADMLGQRF
jgi:hypothetical protein